VKEATGARALNVILDMVGGDYLDRELKCVADEGRIVIIAFLGAARRPSTSTTFLRRRLTVTGSALRPRSVEFKGPRSRVNLLEKSLGRNRGWEDQGGHPQDLPARRGVQGARADGIERAYRKIVLTV